LRSSWCAPLRGWTFLNRSSPGLDWPKLIRACANSCPR